MEDQVKAVYSSFADSVGDLDGRSFVKLCKDAKMITPKFTATDVDLLFTKVKPKSGRKINFSVFMTALNEMAAKKGISVDEVMAKVASCAGPSYNNVTRTDSVRFHDDKSTYTGVHAHGGPTTVDKGRSMVSDISEITDRTPATIRGLKVGAQKH